MPRLAACAFAWVLLSSSLPAQADTPACRDEVHDGFEAELTTPVAPPCKAPGQWWDIGNTRHVLFSMMTSMGGGAGAMCGGLLCGAGSAAFPLVGLVLAARIGSALPLAVFGGVGALTTFLGMAVGYLAARILVALAAPFPFPSGWSAKPRPGMAARQAWVDVAAHALIAGPPVFMTVMVGILGGLTAMAFIPGSRATPTNGITSFLIGSGIAGGATLLTLFPLGMVLVWLAAPTAAVLLGDVLVERPAASQTADQVQP